MLRPLVLGSSFLVATGMFLAPPSMAQDEPAAEVVAEVSDATTEGIVFEENPLATEPKTPDEFFDASMLTLRLARMDLAKYYLQGLLKMDPDDSVLLKLRDKHGSATFLELARVKELQPHASDLLQRLNDASLRRINDPGILDEMIEKLGGDTRDREDAIQGLQHLGEYAVPPLIQRLGDSASTIDPNAIIYALKRLGSSSISPMLGAIQSDDERVRTACTEILGEVGSADESIYLWRPAFGSDEPAGVQAASRRALAEMIYNNPDVTRRITSTGATRKLQNAAGKHIRDEHEWNLDDEGLTSIWTWSPEAHTIAEHKVVPHRASLFTAERLIRDSLQLTPTDSQGQLQLLSVLMSRDVEAAGWDKPVPTGPGTALDLAVTAGPQTCEDVLAMSLKDGNIPASLASLNALAQVGSRTMLKGSKESAAVVISALDAPEQRIQFAAALAILNWQPDKPFQGARRVVEILTRELNADTKPDVVVTDPNSQRGVSLAALFGELGYDRQSAVRGTEGFETSVARGDVEVAVLHLNTIDWNLTPTIANLRADSRTASLPIMITGPADLACRATKLIDEYPRVFYLNDPNNAADVQKQLRDTLAKLTPPPLTDNQRATRIKEAAAWLQAISTGRYAGIFDITPAEAALSDGINNPLIAQIAVSTLATVGTPSAQSRLLDVALAPAMDATLRTLAARSLASHIRNHGMTIRDSQLGELVTSYQAEEDPLIRSALGSILGSVQPKPEIVAERLLSFPKSVTPISSDM